MSDLTVLSLTEGVDAWFWCSRKLQLDVLKERQAETINDEEMKLLMEGLKESRLKFWEAWDKFCKER